jgi:hypothetical protein
MEPAEPMDRIDPLDPMLRIEPAEPADRRELPVIPMPGFSHPGMGSAAHAGLHMADPATMDLGEPRAAGKMVS